MLQGLGGWRGVLDQRSKCFLFHSLALRAAVAPCEVVACIACSLPCTRLTGLPPDEQGMQAGIVIKLELSTANEPGEAAPDKLRTRLPT